MLTLKSNTTNSISNLISDTPAEPQGSYRGSNEFILDNDGKSEANWKSSIQWCKNKLQQIQEKKYLQRRFPILNWLPKYNFDDCIGDIVAGLTVGLTVIPQALAYSNIAGLDPAYGLYSSFIGCFVYIFLGSCKDVPMGPTAIASLLTLEATGGVWQRAVLLGFLVGCIELVAGLLGLGFLIDFISGPVSSGFTSAVSLIILTSQVKNILAIQAHGSTFAQMWRSILHNIRSAKLSDSLLGVGSIIFVLMMKLLVNVNIGPKCEVLKTKKQRIFNKFLWLLGTSRNAILVILSGLMTAYLSQNGQNYFEVIGQVPEGLPTFGIPPFHIGLQKNITGQIIQEEETFREMITRMGSGLIVLPLVLLLENIAVCKAFANGQNIDATQELIAIGVSNICNSFALGYPITGAVSRGAVNHASGVRTQFGNFYTGVLVILTLLFLTPLFAYIPKASLAAIIIAAVVFMVEIHVVKPMWRSKRSDLVPGISAFIACLVLPIEWGILVGIGLNVAFILYHAARPKIRVEYLMSDFGTKYLMITPDRCIIFPSVEYVRNIINKHGLKAQIPIVIDCSHVYGADFTAATVIETLVNDFSTKGQQLLFYNLKTSIGLIFQEMGSKITILYEYDELQRVLKQPT